MKKIILSNRARYTPVSPIRKLAKYSIEAKEKGIQVFHLNIGQPDILSPQEFMDAIKSYDDKVIAYENSRGNEDLRNAWANYLNENYNLNLTSKNLIISMGASEALLFIFMTCCDPGDEVIVFDPTYANYISFGAESGVNLIPVLSDIKNNFKLPSKEEIESKISNRTRAILLCNPNNPTGTAYSKEDIKFLLDFCKEHNFFLVVDEAYREYVYDGTEPFCAMQVEPENERIIIIDSISKRYSLCGARLGALITKNNDVIETVFNIAQARLCAPTIEQYAASKMIQNISKDYIEKAKNEYEKRRNTLCNELLKIDGIEIFKPKGAFYVTVKFPVKSSDDFAKYLLTSFSHEGKTVFIAPASGFYMQNDEGKDKARLAFVLSEDKLIEATKILKIGLEEYLKSCNK